jgi:hypothetical protein
MNLDFSTSQPPTASELFFRLAVMVAVWVSILTIVKFISEAVATIFWSCSIPIEEACIPSKLPHPNPQGSAISFDILLLKATDEQIAAFMSFRGVTGQYSNNDRGSLQQVANSAAGYKGQLYEERTMKWIDDHFRLQLKNLKYPYVGRHWNGWASMWTETASHIRKMFLSSMVVIFEHSVNGLVLPGLYLLTHNTVYYNLALYGEIAYMIYASTLLLASYYLEKDVSVEQMHRSVWSILLGHHIATIMLCTACIMIGESIPKGLVCSVLLALLGLTSSLHYVGQILDFSPLAQSNAPYTRLCNHIFCLASQIVFRAIYWVRLFYLSITHCLEVHGVGTAVTVTLILLFFSLANIELISFHTKSTKGCWMKIQQEKMGKVF